MEPPELLAARCQNCNALTSRKCSACNVCVYCSVDCEAVATTRCFADIACELHRAWPREDANLGPSGAHLRMLPSVQAPLSADAAPHLRWQALHQAAVHYLHVLLASLPGSRVFAKTAFGASVALTRESRYSCGYQRLNFPLGKTSQAAAKIVGNMATLAFAQMGEEATGSPQLRDANVPDKRQAVILSGFVAKPSGDCPHDQGTKSVVHFDSIYLTHANNVWTIKRIQPFWEQELTSIDEAWYEMHYKPRGRVPPRAMHSLGLVEQALISPAQAATPRLAPQAPMLHPTPASSTPPPEATRAATRAEATAAQAPCPTPCNAPPPPPRELPSWEAYRKQAKAAAEATTEAPRWLEQLQAALHEA